MRAGDLRALYDVEGNEVIILIVGRKVGNKLIVEGVELLTECVESGETLVVEMPDHALLAIQSLDPQEDDSLIDELLESNADFRALLSKSKASPRKPFLPG